jgi:hypothetical protein
MGSRSLTSFAAVVVAAVALSACSSSPSADPDPVAARPAGDEAGSGPSAGRDEVEAVPERAVRERAVDGDGARPLGLRLAAYDDCGTFLDDVRGEAAARVRPWGLDTSGSPFGWAVEDTASAEAVDAPAATEAPAAADLDGALGAPTGDDGDQAAGGAPGDVTGTNVQETGVDEADIVKIDGARIITLTGDRLTRIDITAGAPVVTGTLAVPDAWGGQLYLHGDRAYVIGGGQWTLPVDVAPPVETTGTTAPVDAEATFATGTTPPVDLPAPGWYAMPGTVVHEVDLAGAAPTITATLRIEGSTISSRLVGDRLVIAASTMPETLPWTFPDVAGGEADALEANRRLVAAAGARTWTPQYEITGPSGTAGGDLVACDRLHRPAEFAGFDVISLIDLDVSAGLPADIAPAATTGVVASGSTVYASLDRFYVATNRWLPLDLATTDAGDAVPSTDLVAWSETYATDVHAFAITAGAPVAYVGSGTVDGSLLNQFSMSEHEGHLRILTTAGSPWDPSNLSETTLTVLAEAGTELVPVGAVGGLGRGEALYSARMMGDRGYAVTFRQIDPFYVLDLSDPTAPAVTGELKIPGFSTYLHAVGEHRVLGLGKAATDEGQITGFKLSLFDVSDPTRPAEISTWTLPNADSPAEYDHRAFQMIGSTAIVPIREWGAAADGAFNGVVLFDIGDAITEIGRITHVVPSAAPTSDCRVLTADDVPADSELLWMVSDPWMTVQLCGPEAVGGFGSAYCEVVPVTDFPYWFGDPERAAAAIEAMEPVEGARIELCYPQDVDWDRAIQRSVAANGTLYTVSTRSVHAHDLASLAPLGAVDLA